MLKKILIAAAVAAFVPMAAYAAPGHDRFDNNRGHSVSQKYGYHKHGPKIVYKTIYQTKKIVTIKKKHGRFVKIVKWVKVPVKVAFINGKPVHRL